jgi:hypothetical protein
VGFSFVKTNVPPARVMPSGLLANAACGGGQKKRRKGQKYGNNSTIFPPAAHRDAPILGPLPQKI